MTKFTQFFMILFSTLLGSSLTLVTANNPTSTIPVQLQKKGKHNNPKPDLGSTGNRLPSQRFFCTISTTEGVKTEIEENIQTYELWTIDSSFCMAYYVDETEFVEYVFSHPGEYEMRLTTDDYSYSGYLSTL